MILWELVTGELPWGAHPADAFGLARLYDLQLHHPPNAAPVGTLSEGWEATLRVALAPDPAARPQSVRHLLVDLANSLDPVPHAPTGAEILSTMAPQFVAVAPHDANTVRNSAHRTIVVAWPPREQRLPPAVAQIATQFAGPPRGVHTSISNGVPSTSIPQVEHTRTTAAMSTLTASTGVITSAVSTPSTWKLALVAVLAATITTIGLVAVLNRDGGGRAINATAAPATTAPPPSPPAADQSAPKVSPETTASPEATVTVGRAGTDSALDSSASGEATSSPSTTTLPAVTASPPRRGSPPRIESTKKPRSDGDVSARKKPKFDPNAPGGDEEEP